MRLRSVTTPGAKPVFGNAWALLTPPPLVKVICRAAEKTLVKACQGVLEKAKAREEEIRKIVRDEIKKREESRKDSHVAPTAATKKPTAKKSSVKKAVGPLVVL